MWRSLSIITGLSVAINTLVVSSVFAIPIEIRINSRPNHNYSRQRIIINGQNRYDHYHQNRYYHQGQNVIINPHNTSQTIIIPGNNSSTIIVTPNNNNYPNSYYYNYGNYGNHNYNNYPNNYGNYGNYNNYPYVQQRNCTNLIQGSPIPSPVPIDTVTGRFCN